MKKRHRKEISLEVTQKKYLQKTRYNQTVINEYAEHRVTKNLFSPVQTECVIVTSFVMRI